MKKIGVVLVVLLVLAALGLPPVLGRVTQSQVDTRVTGIAGNPLVTARVLSYERGWFASTARIELGLSDSYRAQLDALSAGAAPPTAVIRVDFTHGPIAVADGVHLGASRMTARVDPETPGHAALLQQLAIPYLFEFRGVMGFTGTLAFDADAPPVDITVDGTRFAFSGALLDGALRGRAIRYDGRVDAMELQSDAGGFTLQRLTATGDNELHGSLPLGPAEIVVERLTMSDPAVAAGPVFSAANVRMRSNFALDGSGALANGTQAFTADSIDAQPGVAITAPTLTLEYGNLDADALEAYTETLQRQAAAGIVDPNALLAEITPAVERLLAAEPTFAMSPLRFTYNGQPFDASLNVRTRAAALPPAGALDLRDPTLWLDVLDVRAQAVVAKELARELATQVMSAQFAAADPAMPPDQVRYMAEAQTGLVLVTLVSQGMLVDRGDSYAAEIAFGGGSLTINGAPLPLGLP